MVSVHFHLAISLSFLAVLVFSVPTTFTLNTWFTNFPGFGTPAISASGGSFWVGKPTSSYCPYTAANLTICPAGNVTSFSQGPIYGTLALNTAVPGGQQVYIAPNGLLSYTQPHSAFIPPGSLTTGFVVYPSTAQLSKHFTFWLCNQPDNSSIWQVWLEYEDENGSIKVGGRGPNNACTRFILKAEEVQGLGAWQYD